MTDRTCSVDGCEQPAYCRGFCTKHYQRWRRYGSTDRPRPPVGTKWCHGCKFYLPLSDFYEGKGSQGRQSPCRDCRSKRDKARRKNRGASRFTSAAFLAPLGMKWCNRCKTYLPLDAFHISRARPIGRTGPCKQCTAKAQKDRPELRAAAQRRRLARKRNAQTEKYTATEIANRDGWRCALCGKRIGRKLKWPHSRSLSMDHIVPLSTGGDDLKTNVQAAHLTCNISKHAGGTDQLRLIG